MKFDKGTIITVASIACSVAGLILGNLKQSEMIDKAVAEQIAKAVQK